MNTFYIEHPNAEQVEGVGQSILKSPCDLDVGHEIHIPEVGKFLVIGVEHRMVRFELGYAARVVVTVREA